MKGVIQTVKINWNVRFKNKTWLASFVALIVSTVYQLLSMFEIAPSVDQNTVLQVLTVLLQVLAGIGVIQDPTTAGVSDSDRALQYKEPGKLPVHNYADDDEPVDLG